MQILCISGQRYKRHYWHLEEIILPIGLSFFTFQQIAYLVDVHFRVKRENSCPVRIIRDFLPAIDRRTDCSPR